MKLRLTPDELHRLDQADALLDDAIEADSSRAKVTAARAALEASPLCADAYVLLAVHGKLGPAEKLQVWRAGVSAAEIALGDSFNEYRGEFWGFLETRPYMRARHGLAMELFRQGAFEEARKHLAEMLKLNPTDNQGVRYALMDLLLMRNRDREAAALAKKYKNDESAWMSWGRALVAFRKSGDDAVSRQALTEAMQANAHVPDYLLGTRKLPRKLPDAYQQGERDEAMLYASTAKPIWEANAAALSWLATQISAN